MPVLKRRSGRCAVTKAPAMRAYWANFARTGAPFADGQPDRPAYSVPEDAYADRAPPSTVTRCINRRSPG